MKKLLRKSDEMEMSITFRALRVSYVYSLIFLAVWVVVSVIKTGEIEFLPFMLLTTESLIFYFVEWRQKKKMSGGAEDDE